MPEALGYEDQPAQLRPELKAIVPEVARLALIAELSSGNVCTAFGYSDPDFEFENSVYKLWSEATGASDYAQFEADFSMLKGAITSQGGPTAVREAYLAQQHRQE